MRQKVDMVIEKASEIITLASDTQKPRTKQQMRELGIIKEGSLAISRGKIVTVGKASEIKKRVKADETIDATGKVVMPGFVDPHTHLFFAGSREEELEMKILGSTYLEIHERGGGIYKTVRETRRVSTKNLVESCKRTLDVMLQHGTTTVEAKSGYGLDLENEIKCLEGMRILNKEHPVDLVPTFLGAHAVPLEYKGKAEEYVQLVNDKMIPKVAELKLAEFCDIPISSYTKQQARSILLCGKKNDLIPKVHADEFSSSGGAELAAEVGAISADHLIHSSQRGIEALAQRGVIATLLPGSPFTIFIEKYADARNIIEKGVPVALGTDFSPNCWMESQQMTIALACYKMRMTQSEAIAAATINAAYSINRGRDIGSLEPGKKADIIVLDIPSYRFLGYRISVNLVDKGIKTGKLVVDEGRRLK